MFASLFSPNSNAGSFNFEQAIMMCGGKGTLYSTESKKKSDNYFVQRSKRRTAVILGIINRSTTDYNGVL